MKQSREKARKKNTQTAFRLYSEATVFPDRVKMRQRREGGQQRQRSCFSTLQIENYFPFSFYGNIRNVLPPSEWEREERKRGQGSAKIMKMTAKHVGEEMFQVERMLIRI